MPVSISVVMANYNHVKFLHQSLHGVCAQVPPPVEFLVIDDGSTDDSLAIIEEYARAYPFLRVVRNARPSGGAVAAMHPYIASLKGDYIASAGADDVIYPGFIRTVTDLVERHPGVGACFTEVQIINDQGNPLYVRSLGVQESVYLKGRCLAESLMTNQTSIGGVAAIVDRNAYLWIDEVLQSYDVGYLWDNVGYTAIALKFGACFLPQVLGAFRTATTTISGLASAGPASVKKALAEGRRLMLAPEFSEIFPKDFVEAWSDLHVNDVYERMGWQLRTAHDSLRGVLERVDEAGFSWHHVGNFVLRKLYSGLFRFADAHVRRSVARTTWASGNGRSDGPASAMRQRSTSP